MAIFHRILCYAPLVQFGSNDLFKDTWALIKWISCHSRISLLAPNPFISSVINLQIVALHSCSCLTLMWQSLWLIIDLRSRTKMGALSPIMFSVILFFSPVAEYCHKNILTSMFYVFSAGFGLTLILTLFWYSLRFIIFQKSILFFQCIFFKCWCGFQYAT